MYWLSKLCTWISRWGTYEEEDEEEAGGGGGEEEDDNNNNNNNNNNNDVTTLYQSPYVTVVTTTNIIDAEIISRLDKCIQNVGLNTPTRKEHLGTDGKF